MTEMRTSVTRILPPSAAAFFDVRDEGRAMRVTWHAERDLFVFSLWRDGRCAATFQLARASAPELIDSLVTGVARPPASG
jgi:hypothetical protein